MYFTTSTISPGKTVEHRCTKLLRAVLATLQHIYHLSAHLPSTDFMIEFGMETRQSRNMCVL